MKLYSKISLVLAFTFLSSLAFATSGDEKKAKKNSDTSAQIQQPGDQKPNSEEINPDGTVEDMRELDSQSFDSTQDDSVSKYNFIFYFLYKFKYNEAQETGSLF